VNWPALKHYTSKLRAYSDLESVATFGFRGEALSSLCALSDLHVVTALPEEAPRGMKLEFEGSGELKSKSMVAASKGTTVCVANLFKNLPVRRKELERNIRRDYAKVLGLLQAYAIICVGVKFSVFNQQLKGSAFFFLLFFFFSLLSLFLTLFHLSMSPLLGKGGPIVLTS